MRIGVGEGSAFVFIYSLALKRELACGLGVEVNGERSYRIMTRRFTVRAGE